MVMMLLYIISWELSRVFMTLAYQNGAHLWGDSMYAILVAGVGFEPTTFWL